jgi:hypothetical protein
MATATTERKKPLGVRVTVEQHRVIAEAAAREHRSISSFVLQAAMQAAESTKDSGETRKRRTPEEIHAMLRHAQELMRKANPARRPLVDELIAERREEALRD